MRMVIESDSAPRRVDLPLLRAVARARRWSQDLLAGRAQSLTNWRREKDSMPDPSVA